MRYNRIIILLFLLCNIPLHGALAQLKYEMTDLRILNSERNFSEFFAHALDIRPSLRNDEYKNMLEEMALALLEQLNNKTKVTPKEMALIKSISKWPLLGQNEFFNRKRDFLLLKGLNNCFIEKKDNCLQQAKIIFTDYQHEILFSNDLIENLVLNGIAPEKLWPFAAPLAMHPLSEFYCSKDSFKSVIIAKMSIDFQAKLHNDCLKALKPSMQKMLTYNERHMRSIAFHYLKKINALSNKEESFYYLIEYLQNPYISSDKLEHSLNELKRIKKDPELREQLVIDLGKLDPLPGKIFSKVTDTQSLSKTRILFRSFPEYIDTYARTCLDYLTENKVYKTGSPTPDCHGLFKQGQKLDILPESMQLKYRKATYFTK